MRISKLTTTIAITGLVALGACEAAQQETGEMTETIEEEAEGLGLSQAAEIDLDAKNESGVTGAVTLVPRDGDIEARVRLEGDDPATRYVWHVHEGTCDEGGPVAIDLGRIENSPDGVTEGVATIDRSNVSPSASYFVQVHSGDQAVVACANVSQLAEWAGGEATAGTGATGTEHQQKAEGDTY